MTNLYNLPDVMARLPLIQKAALAEIGVECDAVDYWPHFSEGFPYWWNRIDSMTVDDLLLTQEVDVHRYTVSMGLVIAHLTADGFNGETTHKSYEYIPAVLDFFRSEDSRHLAIPTEASYQLQPNGLWTGEGGALISGVPNGTRTISNSGIRDVQQVAIIFTLDIPLEFQLTD